VLEVARRPAEELRGALGAGERLLG